MLAGERDVALNNFSIKKQVHNNYGSFLCINYTGMYNYVYLCLIITRILVQFCV